MRAPLITSCLLAAALLPALALAQDLPPDFGRYRPMYPGLYLHAGVAQDGRDGAFDAGGTERATATPNFPGATAFPETAAVARWQWHFPMFETYGLPYFSSRLHTARLTVRYSDTTTDGALLGFIGNTDDDDRSEADDLKRDGHGVGDLTLEFGSFLLGSADWRTRSDTPLALLLLGSVNVPTGLYDRDAPINAGSNTWHFQGTLGLHATPWRGALLDAGIGYRDYGNNEEPAFGSLAPHKQGDDLLLDLSLAQRLLQDVYVTGFWTRRSGDANEYRNPVYAPNAPPHPSDPGDPGDPLGTDTFPRPGVYRDGGTGLESVGAALSWFATQRWLLALHWTHPLSGRSGEFRLPYDTKTPSGCMPGSTSCQVAAGTSITVDGMGAARAYSSDRLMVTVTHNFGLGDTFTCTGCER